jgi:glutamine amidotransferase PdxT
LSTPRGQSTIWELAEIFGLADPLHTRVASGMPAFGSCTGMIMPADRGRRHRAACCGRLDGAAVDAVLRAAGHRVRRKRECRPA